MHPAIRVFLIVISVIFLILGLIGLFVPILQGFIFIAIGFYLLSIASLRFKTKMESHIERFPRFSAFYSTYRRKIDGLWRKDKKGREDETEGA
jgi:uncharacterized protein